MFVYRRPVVASLHRAHAMLYPNRVGVNEERQSSVQSSHTKSCVEFSFRLTRAAALSLSLWFRGSELFAHVLISLLLLGRVEIRQRFVGQVLKSSGY